MPKAKILLVSTDSELGKTAVSGLGERFDILHLGNAEEGLSVLGKDQAFKVVLSGMDLPGMGGLEFLAGVRKKHPRIMRILITGDKSFDTAFSAVNDAHVSRFLIKPCPPDILELALTESVGKFDKGQAEAASLKRTLHGCVNLVAEILELSNPAVHLRTDRIRRRALKLSADLSLPSRQLMDMAVLLSHIGFFGLSQSLQQKLETGSKLTKEEVKAYRNHPVIAAHLLGKIPHLDLISEIVRHQNTPCSEEPPMEARILHVCIDMERMESRGIKMSRALKHMYKKPDEYDRIVVETLAKRRGRAAKASCLNVTVEELQPGMVMQGNMVTNEGRILLQKGETLSEASHLRLQVFADLLGIKEPICTLAQESEPSA